MRRPRLRLGQKGFTLVELLAGTVIGLVLTVAFLQLFLFTTQLYRDQQVENEQLILIEGVEEMVVDQLRYAQYVAIGTNRDQQVSGWNTLYTKQDSGGTGLYYNSQTTPLVGGVLGMGQSVSVVFLPVDDYTVAFTVTVTDGDGRTSSHTVQCRLMNMALSGTGLITNTTADGTAIHYIS